MVVRTASLRAAGSIVSGSHRHAGREAHLLKSRDMDFSRPKCLRRDPKDSLLLSVRASARITP